jgi:SAM-dependent methyltransferase
MKKTKEEWAQVFSLAKHGHVLWDGRADDPSNPELAYTTAWEFVDFVKEYGFFKQNDKVLDLGCGNGRFAICFSEMKVEYTGLDPMKEQIEFCKLAFSQYPNLRFHHIDVRNEHFNPKGSVPPDEFRFPFPDNYLDDVIAYSVFTHLQSLEVAQQYMKEIKRVLKMGGRLFITWYRSPPDKSPTDYVGRTVYNEWDIMSMLNGFQCLFSYGGHSGDFYDQWGLVMKKTNPFTV